MEYNYTIEPIKVYIKINNKNEIIDIASELFLNDFTNWIKIDEGNGDKYGFAHNYYLEKRLVNNNGAYNYKYENGKIIENDTSIQDAINSINQQIEAYKQLLANSDYQAIKYAEGELSAEEYAPMKTQRAGWRVIINQLEQQIAQIGG